MITCWSSGALNILCCTDTCVMASSDKISTVLDSAVIEKLEFDLFVTHYVRIWRATFLELGQHIIYNFLFIIILKIPDFKV